MPLIDIVIALIVVGVALWLINNFIPMAHSIKTILNVVVVVAVAIWNLAPSAAEATQTAHAVTIRPHRHMRSRHRRWGCWWERDRRWWQWGHRVCGWR